MLFKDGKFWTRKPYNAKGKQLTSAIFICDSLIPALLSYSILVKHDNFSDKSLIVFEYTSRDGFDENFFKTAEWIFKSLKGYKNTRIVRYYSQSDKADPIIEHLPWLQEDSGVLCNMRLFVSSSSILLARWEAFFDTTILAHSPASIIDLTEVKFLDVRFWKKLIASQLSQAKLYMTLRHSISNHQWCALLPQCILRKLKSREVAAPFTMRSTGRNMVVDIFNNIPQIEWEKFSPKIQSLSVRLSKNDAQAILVLLTGDEPFSKRGNTYNLEKYEYSYKQLFNSLKKEIGEEKTIVIFKSHKRYADLGYKEKKLLTDLVQPLGVSELVFLDGVDAELPVEILPLKRSDLVVSEDSFALLNMSDRATCLYADKYFNQLRTEEEQKRTKYNKQFARSVGRVIKSI